MSFPVFGLLVAHRPYQCSACGNEQEVETNHTDSCYAVCSKCSWMGHKYAGIRIFDTMHRKFKYAGEPPTADAFNPNAPGRANIKEK